MYSQDQYRRKHLENSTESESTLPTIPNIPTIPTTITQTPIMYHDMGYYQQSHNYSNYLMPYGDMIDANAYDSGQSMRLVHHLMPPSAAQTQPPLPLPLPPQMQPMLAPLQPYSHDQMHHHQQMSMMQTQDPRSWYQPPVAMHQQADHR